jgi:hypothetical protein
MNRLLLAMGSFAAGAVVGVLAYKNKDKIEEKGKEIAGNIKELEEKFIVELKTLKTTINEKLTKKTETEELA